MYIIPHKRVNMITNKKFGCRTRTRSPRILWPGGEDEQEPRNDGDNEIYISFSSIASETASASLFFLRVLCATSFLDVRV
jgi:hypothetical protein